MVDLVLLVAAVALGYFMRGEWSRQREVAATMERVEKKVDALAAMFTDNGDDDSDPGRLPS